VEARIGCSSAKVLTEHTVLVVSGFGLVPRPDVLAVPDLHYMDVPLIVRERTGVSDPGRRLIGWC